VVSTRNNAQRNQLLRDFKSSYGRDLIEDLVSETSGDFREVLLALFETPARYDAWSIKKALYGLGTDEQTLIEILFTRTNGQITEMVQEYDQMTYDKRKKPEASIEEDIRDDCSGDFKRLLISACQGNRRIKEREDLEQSVDPIEVNGKFIGMFQVNYEKMCDLERCKRMAKELHVAGEERLGTDEETFSRIFATQDFYTLRVVYDQYVKLSQNDLLNVVKEETSGHYKKGLTAIIQSVKCRPMFFAERLYKSMKGMGTKDSTLIRIVISRSELDMVQIKACFLEKYHQTLYKFIHDDTSGDYRKILCAIVGRN
jgi:annexin A7/11